MMKRRNKVCRKHENQAAVSDQPVKNVMKNVQKNIEKMPCHKQNATLPVKGAFSANKGSDLLLLCSNNRRSAVARPQLLHDGQIIYLRRRI